MASTTTPSGSPPSGGGRVFASEIREITAADELGQSFLPYSLSVITARALPDVRDGLKPVQRRILTSMIRQGLRPAGNTRKCAKVVGDVVGSYHPHGDSAVYDALVRLGQDFSLRVPLVHPQGNFGTLDDPPAAYRYTECKLTEAAMELIGEWDEETVPFRPTFTGEDRDTEPEYLPARFPNLLVNGSSGIAVGMATNMPPHNLAEVVAVLKLVLGQRRPKGDVPTEGALASRAEMGEATRSPTGAPAPGRARRSRPTLEELMAALPGPDFPTGGIVVDDGGLRDAYENGRGSIRVRAKVEVDQVTARRRGLIVTELPYTVGPERVIAKLKELVTSGRLTAVTDVRNLSDRAHGMRIQIEVKPGVDPNTLLTELYRLTPLEETFGINNVALVDGVPTTLGLYELCHHYLEHRLDMVVRRTQFRLRKAQERAHILEGLVIALDNIDRVIAIIRGSKTADVARQALMAEFTLSEIQATAILDMRLRRLTQLERQELIDELNKLRREIADYEKILDSEQRRRTIVAKELDELVEKLGSPRRTVLLDGNDAPRVTARDAPVSFELADEPCILTLSTSGLIGRELEAAHASKGRLGRHDILVAELHLSSFTTARAVTDRGRVLTVTAHEVPEVSGRSRGAATAEVFAVQTGERVVALLGAGTEPILFVTANGTAKRLSGEEFEAAKDGTQVLSLADGDRVVAAMVAADSAEVVMIASDAQALRTRAATVPVQGRTSRGVAGMKLRGDATVVAAGLATDTGVIFTSTDGDTAKLTGTTELPTQGRAAGGVRLTRLRGNNGETAVRLAVVAPGPDLWCAVALDEDPTKIDPQPLPIPVPLTRRDGTSTRTARRVLAAGRARW